MLAAQRRLYQVVQKRERSEVVERMSVSHFHYSTLSRLPSHAFRARSTKVVIVGRFLTDGLMVQKLWLATHKRGYRISSHFPTSREAPLGGAYAGVQAVLRCFAFEITSGGKACLALLTLPLAVTHSCLPNTTLQLTLSRMSTETLEGRLVATEKSDSSML